MAAQSDLDAFMERVLARRDDNWKRLEQYLLDEREALQITGPGGTRVFGFRREYLWYPRDGRFIKSPLTADGVRVGEAERRAFEERWVRREDRRAAGRRAGDDRKRTEVSVGPGGVRVRTIDPASPAETAPPPEAAIRDTLEPGFVSAAYFMRFKFDPGQYALVGRETLAGREVLRIEYYPTRMFTEGRSRPNKELRERDRDVDRKMNKASGVTFWIIPEEHQIVRYEFANTDMDFLPGQWMIRPEGWRAAMDMSQPFPGVWLPATIRIDFELRLAVGDVAGEYTSEFHDYRLASVGVRVR